MRRLLATLAIAGLAVAALAAPASAKHSTAKFDIHTGDGFVALEPGPDVAKAPNGDTVAVVFTGALDAGARTATASGTFEHRNRSGTLLASGEITATGLTTFQAYGCGVAGGDPIPPDFCGGRALIPIHIVAHPGSDPSASAELNGTLEINCGVGPNPPNGQGEGVRVVVPGVINFNKSVSGENIFVAT
jgi:hypothetical protein